MQLVVQERYGVREVKVGEHTWLPIGLVAGDVLEQLRHVAGVLREWSPDKPLLDAAVTAAEDGSLEIVRA